VKPARAMRTICFLLLLLILFGAVIPSPPAKAQDPAVTVIRVLKVEGMITRGTTTYLRQGLETAARENVDVLVFVINTPGGLVDATLDIIQDILNSPIPIITYVAPRGAIAASAGSFILLSGHVAAMSSGSTTGSAMPIVVNPSDGESRPADEKTILFLAGHMRSVARARNRPEEIASRFVTENLALTDQEALETGIVDELADNLDSLLMMIDGREVDVLGNSVILRTARADVSELEMNTQQQFINIISNPEVAFILFLIGFYGLFFGLNTPGTFIPEVIGAICLVLALFGLGMFAVNTTGVVLLILAIVFFIAEVLTPTFGVLTLAGVMSMVLGAMLLPFEPLLPAAWYIAFRRTVLGMAAVTGGFLALVVTKLVPLRKVPAAQSQQGLMGYTAVAIDDLAPQGTVRIRGEIWKARSSSGKNIVSGSRVRVLYVEGMVLIVEEADLIAE
jgi:membrane-bound serine protease (ClpP class)